MAQVCVWGRGGLESTTLVTSTPSSVPGSIRRLYHHRHRAAASAAVYALRHPPAPPAPPPPSPSQPGGVFGRFSAMGYSQAKRAALYALRRRLKALVGVVRGLGSSCEAAVIATARSLLARMTTTECEVFTSSEDGERPPWQTDEAFKECWRTGRLPEVVAVPPPAAEEHDIHDAALKVKVRDEYVAQRRRVLSTVVRAEHPDMERTAQRAEVVKLARKEFKAMDPTSLLRYLQEGWRHLRDCQGVQRSLHALAQPGRRLQAPLAGAPRGYPTRSCRLRGPLCPILSPFPGRYKLWCFFTLYTTDRTQTNTNRDR